MAVSPYRLVTSRLRAQPGVEGTRSTASPSPRSPRREARRGEEAPSTSRCAATLHKKGVTQLLKID